MDQFATKPITADRLAAAIARVLPGRGRSRELRGFDAAELDARMREFGVAEAETMVREVLRDGGGVIARLRAADGPARAGEARRFAAQARAVGLLRVAQAASRIAAEAAPAAAEVDALAALLDPALDELRGWRPPDGG